MTGCRRGWRFGAALSVVILVAACEEFAHTNPLDPQTSVSVTLTGPDSAFALWDTVRFTVTTNPQYTPEHVSWGAQATPAYFRNIAPGVFVANGSSATGAGPYTSSVTVEVDGRRATRPIVLLRRPAALVIGTCASRVDSMVFVSLMSSQGICTTVNDARGYPIPVGAPTVVARDPTMVAIQGGGGASAFTLTALRNGSTYVVASQAGVADSVRVIARQVLASFRVSPSACSDNGLHLAPGDSARIVPTNVGFDARGYAMDTATVRAAVQGVRFLAADGDTSFRVSADGWVRAPASLSRWVRVAGYGASPETASGGCWVFTP